MRKVEKIRLREGLTKRALAAEMGISKDALHKRAGRRAIGRKETVEKIEEFIRQSEAA